MEEDPTPRRSAAARSAEVEEKAQCTEITGQKKQQKVLADLISGQKVLAEELQKQQKVLMAHIEKQRKVLGRQQETLNHLLATLASRPRFSSCYRCGKDGHCPGLPRPSTSHQYRRGQETSPKKSRRETRTPSQ